MRNSPLFLIVAGAGAGLLAGAMGVGGGIVMVPMLVLAGLSQHEAHATSLVAIVPVALAGAARFAVSGEIDLAAASFLVIGTVLGAPLGARLMAKTSAADLRLAFGAVTVLVGVVMVWS